MSLQTLIARIDETATPMPPRPVWTARVAVLWTHRRLLSRVLWVSLLVSLAFAFLIPKQYKSTSSIMPPDQQGSSAMMLAALASRQPGLGPLGALAGSVLGAHSSGALFTDLLRSGTVSGNLIDRFNLQHVYRKRYRIDTAKRLAHQTKIVQDKKSGVITISVEDRSRERARDLVNAYLEELNKLVARTSTSTARRERLFIEQRLKEAQTNLEEAEQQLSRFSTQSNAINIQEQTRAMVGAGARVQAELLVEQSGLESLRQIYGDDNTRVRQSEARIGALRSELSKMTGVSDASTGDDSAQSPSTAGDNGGLYPPLHKLPRLAVSYADLYRRVKVQETVFELLTQQYEMARIEEAKDVPVVSVIDAPSLPEKKSFPPRLIVALLLTTLSFATTSFWLLFRERWAEIDPADPRKELADEILPVVRRRLQAVSPLRRRTQ
jgi:uncharacterized protein involved in exopolysaccharide biosynthesis